MYFYFDFFYQIRKKSPWLAGLKYLITFVGRLGDYPVLVCVALVQPKLDLFDVGRHVLVVNRLEVNLPLVGVTVQLAFLPKVVRHVAE